MFATLLRKTAAPDMAGIGVNAQGIAVAKIARKAGKKPTLLAGDFYGYSSNAAPDALLRNCAQKYRLQKTTCCLVLEEGDYKLLLTEAPKVPDAEMATALRWRIKDLVDAPVAELTLDVIHAPHGAATQQASVQVVAARNDLLRQRIGLLQGAKINLQVIDIAEMAQRNIAALLPQDKTGIAVLSLRPRYGLITLTRDGELYLSRVLNTGLDAVTDRQLQEGSFSQIALQIQRSLDYYEGHLQQPAIRHLALLPLPDGAEKFVEYLKGNLSVAVSLVDLNDLVDHEKELPRDLQAQIFLSFGAALRERAA